MTKSCMPQWNRWKITFSMLREVGIVLNSYRWTPELQQLPYIRIQSWWLGCQRTFLFQRFHQTCGWNGLAVESPPRTAGFSATLMQSHESQHWSDVCPVFPQCLHCKSDLLLLPPLPLKFLLPRPLSLQSPLEGSLDWSLPAREAPILDAKECIFTTVSVIYNNKLDMTKRYRKTITLQVYSLCQGEYNASFRWAYTSFFNMQYINH